MLGTMDTKWVYETPQKKKKKKIETSTIWQRIIEKRLLRFDSYLLLGQWVGALMAVAERIGEEWSASDGIEQSEAHKTMSI